MYTGKDSFTFWFGVVEDRMDPLELGRCRVRILGFHPELQKDFPTDKLPWAQVINPIQSPSLSGKGISPVGLVEGSWVVGFFVDGPSAQLPIIIGSIYGMNEELQDGENFGDGFRDIRESDLLKQFPVDDFSKRDYSDGKGKTGDSRGAQLENTQSSLVYPREGYAFDSSGRDRGTPDVNILAINDISRLDKTIVDIKRKTRGSGLRDVAVDVADCPTPKFTTGVVGLSGANRGTIKGLGVGSNGQQSTSVPSRKAKSKQFVDKPTNNNNIRIDSSKTIDSEIASSLIDINLNVPSISDIGLA
jgi:hypothetical protein